MSDPMPACDCPQHAEISHNPLYGPEPSHSGYSGGCRCKFCHGFRKAYLADIKANKPSKAESSFAPDEGKPVDTGPEPANRECPECNLPMHWDTRRTMHVCGNGHSALPDAAVNKAASYSARRKRESTAIAPVDMTSDPAFIMQRLKLVSNCDKAIDEFDISELETQTGQTFWNRDAAEDMQLAFEAIRQIAVHVDTEPKLEKAKTQFNSAYQSQNANNVRGNIGQALQETLRRAQFSQDARQDIIYRIVGIDGQLTGKKPKITAIGAGAFQPNPSYVSGDEYRQPRAIETRAPVTRAGNAQQSNAQRANAPRVRVIESRYWDNTDDDNPDIDDESYYDDDSDEDYDDNVRLEYYEPSENGAPVVVMLIIGLGAICAVVWLINEYNNWQDRRADAKAHQCEYSSFFNKCDRAEFVIVSTFNGHVSQEEIISCPAHYERAKLDITGRMNKAEITQPWYLGSKAIDNEN